MRKLLVNGLPVIILLVWLMPVSNHLNTTNATMMRNCYLMSLAVVFLAFLFQKYFDIIQLIISISIMSFLLISTLLFFETHNSGAKITYGYLMNYLPFCVLICIKINKFSDSVVIDFAFISVCIIIIAVGILSVLQNPIIESILKTYYNNHYDYLYILMWQSRKTVTFFGTHSIACYIYFLLWWGIQCRMRVKKGKINYILTLGIIFNIIMCQSVSAILCVVLITGYYYYKANIKLNAKKLLLLFLLMIAVAIGIILNINTISNILSSDQNGLLGRFGSSGNLNDTLSYAFNQPIPFGLCDVEGLWLTDGGYYINFLRGGIVMLVLYYFGLYRFLKNNISEKKTRIFLYSCLLLFEVGYQFTMCMRFFMIMLFMVMYYNYLQNTAPSDVKENRIVRN